MCCFAVWGRKKGAYDFVVGGARVVAPGRLLHDPTGDGLKVEQVVALRQQGLELIARLALNLLGVVVLVGRLLDGAHVDGAEVLGVVEVLVEGVGGMDGLEFFRRIFALDKKGQKFAPSGARI